MQKAEIQSFREEREMQGRREGAAVCIDLVMALAFPMQPCVRVPIYFYFILNFVMAVQ